MLLAPGGHIAFVELKRPEVKGKLWRAQKVVVPMLRGLGFRVEVIWLKEQIEPFYEDWLG